MPRHSQLYFAPNFYKKYYNINVNTTHKYVFNKYLLHVNLPTFERIVCRLKHNN